MSMYGNEIARVHAHDNGYTVETKTKPRAPRKVNGKNAEGPMVDSGDGALPDHEWESSVAKSKKDVQDLIGKAHEAHQTSLIKQQYRKLNGKK